MVNLKKKKISIRDQMTCNTDIFSLFQIIAFLL